MFALDFEVYFSTRNKRYHGRITVEILFWTNIFNWFILPLFISSQVIEGLLLSSLLHNWRYCFNIFLVMFSNRCISRDVMMLKNCVTNQRKIFLKFWNKIFHKPLDKLPKGWISDKKRRESGSHSVVDPLLTSNRLEE